MPTRPDFDRSGSPVVDAQRAETGVSGTVGPSAAPLPDAMTRGLWRGGLLGAALGALVLTPLAFIPMAGLAIVARLLIVWAAGAAAGGAAGAVFFGGAVAESEDPDSVGDDTVVPGAMHRRRDG